MQCKCKRKDKNMENIKDIEKKHLNINLEEHLKS